VIDSGGKEVKMNKRQFSLWYYTVSHRQALIRSVGKDGKENIDIYFGDVHYIDIPTTIDGLEIRDPSDSDKEYISHKIGDLMADLKITVLEHNMQKFYVVSSIVKINRNTLAFYELPFDIPSDMGKMFYKPEIID